MRGKNLIMGKCYYFSCFKFFIYLLSSRLTKISHYVPLDVFQGPYLPSYLPIPAEQRDNNRHNRQIVLLFMFFSFTIFVDRLDYKFNNLFQILFTISKNES